MKTIVNVGTIGHVDWGRTHTTPIMPPNYQLDPLGKPWNDSMCYSDDKVSKAKRKAKRKAQRKARRQGRK